MMFQLVLSEKLRGHLERVAAGDGTQPLIHNGAINRMSLLPGYTKTADADNVCLFHGREVRNVPSAAGGMNFVLHLSHTDDDPEGWTQLERAGYDGWGHDATRQWRDGAMLEAEGFVNFRAKFGPKAFALHHRFFWHLDNSHRLWLSAEDGCEGVYPPAKKEKFFGMFK
jgi:hypothetical protein